jgi:hypothetical protein
MLPTMFNAEVLYLSYDGGLYRFSGASYENWKYAENDREVKVNAVKRMGGTVRYSGLDQSDRLKRSETTKVR